MVNQNASQTCEAFVFEYSPHAEGNAELTPTFGHPSAREELHFLDLHSSSYSPHVE
ncbi:MAG: hypothetical protein RLZZ578_563, partial [Bacteroidota bacterium]